MATGRARLAALFDHRSHELALCSSARPPPARCAPAPAAIAIVRHLPEQADHLGVARGGELLRRGMSRSDGE